MSMSIKRDRDRERERRRRQDTRKIANNFWGWQKARAGRMPKTRKKKTKQLRIFGIEPCGYKMPKNKKGKK